MSQINRINVINILLATFSVFSYEETPINDAERKLANVLKHILQDAIGEILLNVESIDSLKFEKQMLVDEAQDVGDHAWEEEDENTRSELSSAEKSTCSFKSEAVNFECRKDAVDGCRSGKREQSTLERVKHRYRKVVSMKQLRKGAKQVKAQEFHMYKLRLSEHTLLKFIEATDRLVYKAHHQHMQLA